MRVSASASASAAAAVALVATLALALGTTIPLMVSARPATYVLTDKRYAAVRDTQAMRLVIPKDTKIGTHPVHDAQDSVHHAHGSAAASPAMLDLEAVEAVTKNDGLTGFDMTLATQALLLSTAAYCRSTVPSWTCGPCKNSSLWQYTDIKTFSASSTDTFGYTAVAPNEGYIVVSFEGSHDLQQFIDDLKFFKVDTQYPGAGPDVKVHGGFYNSYKDVSATIKATVGGYLSQNPNLRVLVTGHSLGAAIAVFCSLDLIITYPNAQISHYTFGQPRVGNPDFYQFYEKYPLAASFRMTHNHDIVPHLPLEDMGFHHIATEVFYKTWTGPSCLKICNGSGEDPTCSDSNLTDLSVADHLHYMGYHLSSDSC